jgi:prepilin-type N-terminal cleavage/methylation domain-containing protein
MKRKTLSQRAFTLIELLVVISIIAILASLAFPAVNGALDSAKRAKAKNDVVQIVTAIKAYQAEYGRLPTAAVSSDDKEEASQGWFQSNNDEIIRVLTGENYNSMNPRKITFLETRPAKGNKDGVGTDGKFYDPWGTPYAIKLDTSYNNSMEYYDSAQNSNLRITAFAVSFGKNKKQQNPASTTDGGSKVDDIVSYQ